MKDSGNNTQKNNTPTALVRVTGNKQFKLVCYLTYLVDNDLLPKNLPSKHLDHLMFHTHRETGRNRPLDELSKQMEKLGNEVNVVMGVPEELITDSRNTSIQQYRESCPKLSSGMDEPLTPD